MKCDRCSRSGLWKVFGVGEFVESDLTNQNLQHGMVKAEGCGVDERKKMIVVKKKTFVKQKMAKQKKIPCKRRR